ncbi:MAG: VOC family protein [Anaerolineae bacterium]|nr:MAG: VOC family protein [Anaerolineae bacterium]
MAFVATADPERALAFYRDVLGLQFLSDEPYALIFDAHGIILRIQKVQQLTPQPFTALGWWVDDIQKTASDLAARGVVFERFPGFKHDSLGIFEFPDGARVAWFKDLEGNLLSLTEAPLGS